MVTTVSYPLQAIKARIQQSFESIEQTDRRKRRSHTGTFCR
jgi:hypothetical protein